MAGLPNYGNNCYVNAIIQCLRYTTPIVMDLVQYEPDTPLTTALCTLLYEDGTNNLKALLANLGSIHMDPCLQSDAHEFYLGIVDAVYHNRNSPVAGTMVSTLTCPNHHVLHNKQPFISTSINGNIESGIAAFEAAEQVDAVCEKCSACTMEKRLSLSPGKVWVLHLKRFNTQKKLTYTVDVPQTFERYGRTWKLTAICNHRGTTAESGHYTAAVCSSTGWFMCNDALITHLDNLPATSDLPYLLFYMDHTKTLS